MKDFCSKAKALTDSGVNFATANHMHITEVREGFAAAELQIVPESRNPLGGVHGGCLVTLADAACAVASRTYGRLSVTLNMSMSYLAPSKGDRVRCEATVIHKGRTTAVCQADLYDAEGTKVAMGTYTFYIKNDPLPEI